MPALTRDQLRGELRNGVIRPVYVFYGDEVYFRDLAASTIADRTFAEGDLRDFNDTTFELSNGDDFPRAIAACRQLPMMARRRVVRVGGVRISATGKSDTIKDEHEDILKEYLADPGDTTVLIITANEFNGNRRMTKLLKANAATVEFAPLHDAEMKKWADDKFRGDGVKADPAVVAHIVALTGNDMRRLSTEVEKLTVAALDSGTVTHELVDQLVSNEREISNFDLTDRLNDGDPQRTVATLQKILNDGAEPLAILGMLSYNYRRLLMAKDLMDRRTDRRDMTRMISIRPDKLESFLAAARRSTYERLTRAIQLIADADLAIKTSIAGGGKAGGRMVIEVLVCELAGGGDQMVAVPRA